MSLMTVGIIVVIINVSTANKSIPKLIINEGNKYLPENKSLQVEFLFVNA